MMRTGFLPAWIWANKYEGMQEVNLTQRIEYRQEKFVRCEALTDNPGPPIGGPILALRRMRFPGPVVLEINSTAFAFKYRLQTLTANTWTVKGF